MNSYPECCHRCRHLDTYAYSWGSSGGYYCRRMIWLPTRKKTCKKQDRPYPKPKAEEK